MISRHAIPLISRDVVHRNDPKGVLLFQVRTDEIHFLDRNAYSLFQLCDGSRTISEIEELLVGDTKSESNRDPIQRFERFLNDLAERDLIEVWE